MRRRQCLAAAVTLGMAGCSGGGGNDNGTTTNGDATTEGVAAPRAGTATETATATATDTPAATPTETATAGPATTTNGSGGLPDPPGNGTPGTPTGEFTTSAATTPMSADTFVETLEGRIDEKSLMTGYVLNTRVDEQVVELTYVAEESNQRERLEAFAESFVETVRRAGGTGGWSLAMTVQTGADRNVWYTWRVTNEWAVQRLTGELSREEFYAKIEGTTTTPTPSG